MLQLITEKSSNSSVAAMEMVEEVQNQPNDLTPKRIKINDDEDVEDRISPMLDCLILEITYNKRSH